MLKPPKCHEILFLFLKRCQQCCSLLNGFTHCWWFGEWVVDGHNNEHKWVLWHQGMVWHLFGDKHKTFVRLMFPKWRLMSIFLKKLLSKSGAKLLINYVGNKLLDLYLLLTRNICCQFWCIPLCVISKPLDYRVSTGLGLWNVRLFKTLLSQI